MNRRALLAGTTCLLTSKALAFGRLGGDFGNLGSRKFGASVLPPAFATNAPDLFLNFQTNKALTKSTGLVSTAASLLTTVRAAPPAYVNDASGNWTSVAANTPRITNLGLLVEEARTNLVTNSTVPTVANSWTNENCTLTLQASSGPGSGLAAYLYDDGTTAAVTHRLISQPNLTIVTTTTYTMSVFAKSVSSQFVQMAYPSATFGATAYANFDILNGVLGTVGASATAQIIKYPNGWVQIAITATSTSGGVSQSVFITNAPASNSVRSPSYTGVNNQFLVWNQQLEAGASVTSPIVTAGSSITRAADVVTLTSPPVFGSAYSLYAKGTPQAPAAYGTLQTILDLSASSTNRVALYKTNTTALMIGQSISGGTATSMTDVAWPQNVSGKTALADANADQAMSFNGAAVQVGAGTLPVGVNAIGFGQRQSVGDRFWNGFVEQSAFWVTQRITNAQLQAITSPTGFTFLLGADGKFLTDASGNLLRSQ